MKILGIETSCDETAVCIIEAGGGFEAPTFKILGNALYSQVKIHAEYGGVFPALAKREHAKNLTPLLEKTLRDAGSYREGAGIKPTEEIRHMLEREPGLFDTLSVLASKIERPDIDMIAVTSGPGLEPALWVGINFAQALGQLWNIPVLPTNHMEGHIMSPLINSKELVTFPALALLISGGHTELVLVEHWLAYEVIGRTRDDAVGEAFDKVARLLSLPYPGGPEVSRLAAIAREKNIVSTYSLPRPMIKSDDLDFSFSGIKTSVLYTLKRISPQPPLNLRGGEGGDIDMDTKLQIAREFEDAVTEVLIAKTRKAIELHGAKTLILGGGVTANSYIKDSFRKLAAEYPELSIMIPEKDLSTDNAVMIAMAGYLNACAGKSGQHAIKAEGNLQL